MLLVLILLAALGAGAVAGSAALGGGVSPDVWASDAELGADAVYAHGPAAHRTRAALIERYDAKVRRRCATAAYRLRHPTTCPSLRVYGAKRSQAVRRTLGTQQAHAMEPSVAGAWSATFPGGGSTPVVPVHGALLPTGEVLMFGPTTPRSGNSSTAFLLDPGTKAITPVPPPKDPATNRPYNLWCAGQTVLANGTVLVAGGNLAYQDTSNGLPVSASNPVGWKGLNRLFTFDPWTRTWTDQGPMDAGRWYPTVMTLADGRAIIYGGWDETGTNTYASDIAIFTPNPTNRRGKGTLQVKSSSINPGLYPRLTLLPDGNVLMAGPREADFRVLNTNTWTWSGRLSTNFSRRYWGSAVLMPFGPGGPARMMRIGGADASTKAVDATTPILNLTGLSGGEQPGPAMTSARAHLNTVILPDGGILAVGGGLGDSSGAGLDGGTGLYGGAIYTSELYDPATNSWRLGASQSEPRTYHSIALLLPDATVLSAGDDRNAVATTNDDKMEIYSPPYLYRGARPSVSSAPDAFGYGQSFGVATPDPGAVRDAILIKVGAVTHAFDNDQRAISLRRTATGSNLVVDSPTSASVAPPGYYMLFLVNAQGVPSAARIVLLDPSVQAPTYSSNPSGAATPPGAPPPGTGTAARKAPAPRLLALRVLRVGRRTVVTFRLDRKGKAGLLRCGPVVKGRTPKCVKVRVRRTGAKAFRASLGQVVRGPHRLRYVLVSTAGARATTTRTIVVGPRGSAKR
ncbi:MAG TPA: DUF1929 domain-containing protein [Miltoncostaeaceae bacterium]|nr:DUF1929 domain-containing protein [Miltoncostaeaceae bacterium]